jgi:cell division protein FtsI (penicillin-binding protein 3)
MHYPNIKPGYFNAIQEVLLYLKVPATSTSHSEWMKSNVQDTVVELQPMPLSIKRMPNLIGMGAKDAVFLLEKMGLRVQVVGKGKIVHQSIAFGMNYRKGSAVRIELE